MPFEASNICLPPLLFSSMKWLDTLRKITYNVSSSYKMAKVSATLREPDKTALDKRDDIDLEPRLSIEDIFKSIQPELTIFMGAYDTNFNWNMARQEAVRYSTAFTNLLSAYSMTGNGRLVYLVP